MSDCSLYLADYIMNHWPYLRKTKRATELAGPRDHTDSSFLALVARSPIGSVLTWNASAVRIYGKWRHGVRT
jgi:hypothetical protein